MLELRRLDRSAVRTLYDTAMRRDFPAEELKPFAAMDARLQDGSYEPLQFYQQGKPAAYAMLLVPPGCPCALLDYFAVEPRLRGAGAGTAALHTLAEHYALRRDCLLIECEHPAEAPDPAAARRRIAFYLRAGARATAIETRLFGARYLILSLPCGADRPDAALAADLKKIYRITVPEPYYRGSVIFYGD